MADDRRLPQLDGLRGVAAVVVVIFHFLLAFIPSFLPHPLAFAPNENPAETLRSFWLADSPVGILFNGPFAVYVFFVLSGFVVSNAAANRNNPVYLNVLFRYLRLSIPTTASIILAWMLLGLFPDKVRSLNLVLPHNWLELIRQSPLPPLSFALTDGFLNVFKDGFSSFNVVLWTMKIELFGSLAIYLVYGLVESRMRLAVLFLASISCLLLSPLRMYLGFAFGVGLREVWITGLQLRYGAAALFIGVLLGGPALGFMRRIGLEHVIGDHTSLFAHIAALLIVYGALNSKLAAQALSTAPVQSWGASRFRSI